LHDQTDRHTDFLDSEDSGVMASHILTHAVRNVLENGQIEKGDSHSEYIWIDYEEVYRQTGDRLFGDEESVNR
jgi:hypothetical protein